MRTKGEECEASCPGPDTQQLQYMVAPRTTRLVMEGLSKHKLKGGTEVQKTAPLSGLLIQQLALGEAFPLTLAEAGLGCVGGITPSERTAPKASLPMSLSARV